MKNEQPDSRIWIRTFRTQGTDETIVVIESSYEGMYYRMDDAGVRIRRREQIAISTALDYWMRMEAAPHDPVRCRSQLEAASLVVHKLAARASFWLKKS